VYDEQGRPETIQYHVLPVLLLNEMKKQQATINDLNDVVAAMNEAMNIQEQAQERSMTNLAITIESMNKAIETLQQQMEQFMQHMQLQN